jgi:hypothetical protein
VDSLKPEARGGGGKIEVAEVGERNNKEKYEFRASAHLKNNQYFQTETFE